MTKGTRQVLTIALPIAAVGWWVTGEAARGWAGPRSAWAFWFRLTAPLVAIVLMVVALWLIIGSERLQRHYGRAPNPTLHPA